MGNIEAELALILAAAAVGWLIAGWVGLGAVAVVVGWLIFR